MCMLFKNLIKRADVFIDNTFLDYVHSVYIWIRIRKAGKSCNYTSLTTLITVQNEILS